MHFTKRVRLFSGSIALAVLLAMFAVFGSDLTGAEASSNSFTFNMVPSNAAIKTCLPKASGTVTIKTTKNGQKMTVRVKGLPKNTDYDLFVIQEPGAPFGLSWYQSDLHVDHDGDGEATVVGIFSNETFTVSPAQLTTKGREGNDQTGAQFGAVNMYHLGLWFNDPKVPFQLGCEPGKTSPVVTPFNGEQNAGIQVLNTSNFDINNGPLKQVK